jgi:poly [ADP-ribose] polymerase
VKREDKLFGLIEKYVKHTHAKTHNQYRMEVTDVFEMERSGEKEAFNDVGNR